MKKAIIITLCVLLIAGLGIWGVLFFAPYTSVSKTAGTVPAKVERYSLSTTLEGLDCYLDQLDKLKKDGMTHVELCLREDYEEQAALYPDGVKKIKDAGLEVWSVHLPYGDSVSPAAPDEATRLENVENIKRFVELTKDSGAKTFVIHGSYEPITEEERPAMLEAAVTSLRELNDYMNEQGLTLALENLPRSCIGNTIEEMGYIADQVPDLKFCFDTNHFTLPKPNYDLRPLQRLIPSLREKNNPGTGDPVAYAEKFAGRIATVHISDYDGVDECHWFPGQGIVDFASIHNILMDAGYDAPITFEPNERCKGLSTTGERLINSYEKAIGIQA